MKKTESKDSVLVCNEEVPTKDNQLAVIVRESGLIEAKAKILLDSFSNYFAIATEWETKARSIVVKDASQVADMKMARIGRLFLREKRVAIEHTRKQLKEQALREGKAIDGIANVLKALIVPIEEYLEQQEFFVQIQQAKEAEVKRFEAEKKAEEERIAKEKAEAEERERIRKENERLRLEAEERERKIAEERAKAEAERKRREAERIAYEKKVKAEREEAQRKAKEKHEKQAWIIAQQKEKVEMERKKREAERFAYEKKFRKEQEESKQKIAKAKAEILKRIEAEKKARAEKERQAKIIADFKAKQKAREEAEKKNMIVCPFCHRKFRLDRHETEQADAVTMAQGEKWTKNA